MSGFYRLWKFFIFGTGAYQLMQHALTTPGTQILPALVSGGLIGFVILTILDKEL